MSNGIRLHVVTDGPEDGPPVLLLHGFPEFWYGWRHQIPALAAAGYRVIAPDMRGYNKSDKPKGLQSYTLDVLAADIAGLIDALGYEQVRLVGHDWGGAVAWVVAFLYPERIKKLAILNSAQPWVLERAARKNPEQRRRSWYILFFQLPLIPELALGWGNWNTTLRVLKRSGLDQTFSPEDLEAYRASYQERGTMTAMLNYYRSAPRSKLDIKTRRVPMPVQVIWGKQDVALTEGLAEASLKYTTDGSVTFIDEATHWVQHDAPEQVNQILLDFFQD
ncbi:MAG: alpha/beta hydrolase [Chloroflexi bacterium]|nr:alpha/beta hydrolase [Chloroflexota bacterium]